MTGLTLAPLITNRSEKWWVCMCVCERERERECVYGVTVRVRMHMRVLPNALNHICVRTQGEHTDKAKPVCRFILTKPNLFALPENNTATKPNQFVQSTTQRQSRTILYREQHSDKAESICTENEDSVKAEPILHRKRIQWQSRTSLHSEQHSDKAEPVCTENNTVSKPNQFAQRTTQWKSRTSLHRKRIQWQSRTSLHIEQHSDKTELVCTENNTVTEPNQFAQRITQWQSRTNLHWKRTQWQSRTNLHRKRTQWQSRTSLHREQHSEKAELVCTENNTVTKPNHFAQRTTQWQSRTSLHRKRIQWQSRTSLHRKRTQWQSRTSLHREQHGNEAEPVSTENNTVTMLN